jgi:CheY-like chemotaxis protein
VVDDDPVIRRTLAEILAEDYGHNIKTASDGREALEVLLSVPPPALVLVDLMMPRMDGAAFIACTSEQPALSGVHFCVMTAYGRRDDLARLAPAIARDVPVLRKPFDLDELMSLVERYC